MAKRTSIALYLLAAGAGLTALGFIVRLFESAEDADGTMPVPAGLPGVAGAEAAGAVTKALPAPRGKMKDVKTIQARCAEIARLVRSGGKSAKVHEVAKTILSAKNGNEWQVKPRDWKGECRAIFRAITDPASPYAVRYTCDMREADTFSSAERTLFVTHAGDCDDLALVIGALLMSVGYAVKLRVVQAKGKASWSHIYVLAGIPPSSDAPAEWFPLDGAVETKPAGWQAPGAEDAAKYGRPAGMIERTLDFPVG